MIKHGASAIWFEHVINPHPCFPNTAIACLDWISRYEFEANMPAAIASARWRVKPHEHISAFRERIRSDLQAEGIRGITVVIYQHGGYAPELSRPAPVAEPASEPVAAREVA